MKSPHINELATPGDTPKVARANDCYIRRSGNSIDKIRF